MKGTQFVLKIVAAALALAAAVCCVIAFWDQLTGALECAKKKLNKRCDRCDGEYDAYVDWDAE